MIFKKDTSRKALRLLYLFFCMALVVACNSDSQSSTAPIINIHYLNDSPSQSNIIAEVLEGETITPDISYTDLDGSIVDVEWSQLSGTAVELDDSGGFLAPRIDYDETLFFEITVTDNNTRSTTKRFSVRINAYKNIDDINFLDDALSDCVYSQLQDQPSILPQSFNDIKEIIDLDCTSHELTSLQDLSHFVFLQSFSNGNSDFVSPLDDLSPLSNLQELNNLKLNNNWI